MGRRGGRWVGMAHLLVKRGSEVVQKGEAGKLIKVAAGCATTATATAPISSSAPARSSSDESLTPWQKPKYASKPEWGDGFKKEYLAATHTDMWMQGDGPSPMEMVQQAEPIAAKSPWVACNHGNDGPCGLGAPIVYLNVSHATKDRPAVCKYCGLRFYNASFYV